MKTTTLPLYLLFATLIASSQGQEFFPTSAAVTDTTSLTFTATAIPARVNDTPPALGTRFVPASISSNGIVAGYGTRRPLGSDSSGVLTWTAKSGFGSHHALPEPYFYSPNAVGRNGWIIGFRGDHSSPNYSPRAAALGNRAPALEASPDPSLFFSRATTINTRLEMAGCILARWGSTLRRPARWTAEGKLNVSSAQEGCIESLNIRGLALGNSPQGITLWYPSWETLILDPRQGSKLSINNAGQIVYTAADNTGWFWSFHQGKTQIPMRPVMISNRGLVIGNCGTTNDPRAYMWSPKQKTLIDLNERVTGLPSNKVICQAIGLSQANVILVATRDSTSPNPWPTGYFLLTPVEGAAAFRAAADAEGS